MREATGWSAGTRLPRLLHSSPGVQWQSRGPDRGGIGRSELPVLLRYIDILHHKWHLFHRISREAKYDVRLTPTEFVRACSLLGSALPADEAVHLFRGMDSYHTSNLILFSDFISWWTRRQLSPEEAR